MAGASQEETGTAGAGAVLLTTTFFVPHEEDFGPDRAEDLHDVSAAIDTLARFLETAFLLAEWDEATERNLTPYQRRDRARRAAQQIEIVSISLNTPLKVVLKIPADVLTHIAGSVITLGERICRAPTKVAAGRAEDKLRKALAERAEQLVKEGKLDMAAQELVTGIAGRRSVQPEGFEITDPDAKEATPFIEVAVG
jgi:hypothetical protein